MAELIEAAITEKDQNLPWKTPAQTLKYEIETYLKKGQYDEIAMMFSKKSERETIKAFMPEISLDLYRDVCLKNLTDDNFTNDNALYCCVEELFKEIAKYAPKEEIHLELLEFMEEKNSEHLFTTILKGLQTVLMRFGKSKPRAFEWTYNSILTNLEEITMPQILKEGYDEEQERLLEEQPVIQSLLMRYVIIGFFLEPLLVDILENNITDTNDFIDTTLSRRNLTVCFLIQLLEGHIGYLDLTLDERKTNSYTLQCVKTFTDTTTKLIGDPMILLESIVSRQTTSIMKNSDAFLYELSLKNVFLIEEKLPTAGVAIYFYMLLCDPTKKTAIPTVYSALYIFDCGIYLVNHLLRRDKPALNYKGLLLLDQLMDRVNNQELASKLLDSSTYRQLTKQICSVAGYSEQLRLRKLAAILLKKFIFLFDDVGKYIIIKNMMFDSDHNGIQGFLSNIYKDCIGKALDEKKELCPSFKGPEFKAMFMENICHLPRGVETDVLRQADSLTSTLNIIRFFAIRDLDNETGFWNFINEIETKFMEPLYKALEISKAHYVAELKRVEQSTAESISKEIRGKLETISVKVVNDADSLIKQNNRGADRVFQMNSLKFSICNLDLILSLYGRANDCIQSKKKLIANTLQNTTTLTN